jgi:uncharacterized protein (DUF2235 family)
MAKNVVLLFDGTWNKPAEPKADGAYDGAESNICRLLRAVEDQPGQVAWYDEGVGTGRFERLRGGLFGYGLSENVRQGYAKLAELWEPGDPIFVFGFSRGAHTARSMVGMVRKCGLVPREGLGSKALDRLYDFYRRDDVKPGDAEAVRFRAERGAREPRMRCLGVFDTVGALGIPIGAFNWFNQRYEFHDTELSGIVENAFQALAVDEWRKPYRATLWDPKEKPGQTVEQCWFVGAHSDIGGGYRDGRLAQITLHWMAMKAAECGLKLDFGALPPLDGREHLDAAPHDSWKEFLSGLFALVSPRYLRPLLRTGYGRETIHPTVLEKIARSPRYRPENDGLKERWPSG